MPIAMWRTPGLVAKYMFNPTGHSEDNVKDFIGAGTPVGAGRVKSRLNADSYS